MLYDIAFGLYFLGVSFCIVMAMYHGAKMIRGVRPEREKVAPFFGFALMFLPRFFTEHGNHHRRMLGWYSTLALLMLFLGALVAEMLKDPA